MSRSRIFATVAVAVVTPVLWMAPAFADPGYPPTGPTGGSTTVTFTGGGSTVNLPHTGQDVQDAALLGGAAVLGGSALLLLARRSRRAVRTPA